jgi:hypothetical protein
VPNPAPAMAADCDRAFPAPERIWIAAERPERALVPTVVLVLDLVGVLVFIGPAVIVLAMEDWFLGIGAALVVLFLLAISTLIVSWRSRRRPIDGAVLLAILAWFFGIIGGMGLIGIVALTLFVVRAIPG